MKKKYGLYYSAILTTVIFLAFLGLSINIKTSKANETIPSLQKKLYQIQEQNKKLELKVLEKKTLSQLDKHAQLLGLKPIKHKIYVSESITP